MKGHKPKYNDKESNRSKIRKTERNDINEKAEKVYRIKDDHLKTGLIGISIYTYIFLN